MYHIPRDYSCIVAADAIGNLTVTVLSPVAGDHASLDVSITTAEKSAIFLSRYRFSGQIVLRTPGGARQDDILCVTL